MWRNWFRSLYSLLHRDVLLVAGRRQEVITALAFFVLVLVFFPLAIGAEIETLRLIAPGAVWVAAALASLVSLDRLFADDWRDGSLEQMLLQPTALEFSCLIKVIAHWLALGLPLVVLAPVLGYSLGLRGEPLLVLAASLLIGTPVLCLLGSCGAALLLGLRAGGALLALLILPLYVPVLILGAGAVSEAVAGQAFMGYLGLLAAILVLAILLAPLAIAAAVRIALD